MPWIMSVALKCTSYTEGLVVPTDSSSQSLPRPNRYSHDEMFKTFTQEDVIPMAPNTIGWATLGHYWRFRNRHFTGLSHSGDVQNHVQRDC